MSTINLHYDENPQPDFNLTTEYKNVKDSKKADGAIVYQVMQKETGVLTSHSTTKVLESYYIDPQILSVVEKGAIEIKIFGADSSL